MKKLFILACIVFANVAGAASSDLKSFMQVERVRMGTDNPGYKMQGQGEVCEALRSVGLGCSYNERYHLIDFLQENGVVLFPCKGGTNPYTKDRCDREPYDWHNYIGQPVQNKMLAQAVRRNRNLFVKGNLTKEQVKKWK
jgi:hypothetical protein